MRFAARLAGAALAAALTSGAAFAGDEENPTGPPPPEPFDYRFDDYRSPTPLTLEGAKVVDTRQAEALWREGRTAFLDVMPRDSRPKDLPAGTVWRDKPRENIPGSSWLANVGYGGVSPELTAYFRDALLALSGGDKTRPLLFYCRAACWMSWNAAKRAIGWGYTDVIWYPDGADGWEKAALPLEKAKPYGVPAAPSH